MKSEKFSWYHYVFGVLFLLIIGGLMIFQIILGISEKMVASFNPEKENIVTTNTNYAEENLSLIQKYSENMPLRDFFVNSLGALNQNARKTYFFNGVSRDIHVDKTGRLTYLLPYQDVTPYVNAVVDLNQFLQQKELPFLYVQAPSKILKGEDVLYHNLKDYSNDNADTMVQALQNQSVPVLDLRESLTESNRYINPLFFFTDSRWTPDAAFSSYLTITNTLKEKYGMQLDTENVFSSLTNFQVQVYENSFAGNQAKVTGESFLNGKDNLNIITPYSITNFDVTITKTNGDVINRKGSFEKSVIDQSKISAGETAGKNKEGVNTKISTNVSAYLAGPSPSIVIKNLKKSGLDKYKKLLIIGDELSNEVASFLCLNFRETHVINPNLFTGSIKDYITLTSPDVVLCLESPQSFNSSYFRFSSPKEK